MSFLNDVCAGLTQARVRYAVVGGHAVALHGAVRGTVDIDIVVNWRLNQLRATQKVLNRMGLVSRLPIDADEVFNFRDEYVRNRNLIGWNFYHPDDPTQQVDIVITYDLTGKKTNRIDTTAGPVTILNVKELIEMKRESGRPQDHADVDALERLR